MLTKDPRHAPAGGRRLGSRAPLILMGVGLALVIAAVLIVPAAMGDNDAEADPGTQAPAANSWVRAYIYDGATGQGVSINPDGSVIESYNDMGRFIDSRVVARSRSITFIGETIEIGPVPGDRSGPGTFSLPIPEEATVSVLGVPDRLVMALHYEDGGNITLIDADKRRTLDVGELLDNPQPNFTIDELQLEPSGERFAIYDRDRDETAVISWGRPQPRYYKNRALAISADRVTTVHTQDKETIVTIYDSNGSVVSEVTTTPLVGATMDGRTAYLIAENDDVLRIDPGESMTELLARVPDSKKVAVASNGERFIVDSPWGFIFLNAEGTQIGQLRPGEGGVQNPQRDSLCLATDVNQLVTRSDVTNTVQRGPSLLRLDDLKLDAVTQLPVHTSTPDKCTVATEISETNTYQLVSITNQLNLGPTGDIPVVGPYDRMFLSPNPNQWIGLQPDQSVGLFELVDGEAQLIKDIPFPDVDYIVAAFVPAPPNE